MRQPSGFLEAEDLEAKEKAGVEVLDEEMLSASETSEDEEKVCRKVKAIKKKDREAKKKAKKEKKKAKKAKRARLEASDED